MYHSVDKHSNRSSQSDYGKDNDSHTDRQTDHLLCSCQSGNLRRRFFGFICPHPDFRFAADIRTYDSSGRGGSSVAILSEN